MIKIIKIITLVLLGYVLHSIVRVITSKSKRIVKK
jgi:hypothetical protein